MQLLPDHYLCKDVDQHVCGEITVNYIIKKVNSKLKWEKQNTCHWTSKIP